MRGLYFFIYIGWQTVAILYVRGSSDRPGRFARHFDPRNHHLGQSAEIHLDSIKNKMRPFPTVKLLYLQERNRIEHLMFTARKASVEDCGLIREMACVAFPDTYKTILSPEQLDYMMEWMYSPENLRRQMAEGHVYYIAYKDGTPCGYLSVQPEAEDLYILQKIYILPRFQGVHAGSFLFRKAIEHIKQLHPAPCRIGAPRKSP